MAAEWTRHAFRRACARRIEIEIHYQKRQFGVRVRDEGKWIDPQVLHEGGRSGHRGIPGVHERAKLAGGNLAVWSDVESGAEIELTIPAVLTYAKAASGREPPASGKGTGLDKNPEIGKL
jgi:nitrate/nitrite-specific signal transduction histidine kinase